MNKTVLFVTFAALAAIGLVGGLVLLIHRPDATATFTSLLVTVLGLVATAAGTFYALGKQGDKLEQIHKQTNGTLSALQEENARLTAQLLSVVGNAPAANPNELD